MPQITQISHNILARAEALRLPPNADLKKQENLLSAIKKMLAGLDKLLKKATSNGEAVTETQNAAQFEQLVYLDAALMLHGQLYEAAISKDSYPLEQANEFLKTATQFYEQLKITPEFYAYVEELGKSQTPQRQLFADMLTSITEKSTKFLDSFEKNVASIGRLQPQQIQTLLDNLKNFKTARINFHQTAAANNQPNLSTGLPACESLEMARRTLLGIQKTFEEHARQNETCIKLYKDEIDDEDKNFHQATVSLDNAIQALATTLHNEAFLKENVDENSFAQTVQSQSHEATECFDGLLKLSTAYGSRLIKFDENSPLTTHEDYLDQQKYRLFSLIYCLNGIAIKLQSTQDPALLPRSIDNFSKSRQHAQASTDTSLVLDLFKYSIKFLMSQNYERLDDFFIEQDCSLKTHLDNVGNSTKLLKDYDFTDILQTLQDFALYLSNDTTEIEYQEPLHNTILSTCALFKERFKELQYRAFEKNIKTYLKKYHDKTSAKDQIESRNMSTTTARSDVHLTPPEVLTNTDSQEQTDRGSQSNNVDSADNPPAEMKGDSVSTHGQESNMPVRDEETISTTNLEDDWPTGDDEIPEDGNVQVNMANLEDDWPTGDDETPEVSNVQVNITNLEDDWPTGDDETPEVSNVQVNITNLEDDWPTGDDRTPEDRNVQVNTASLVDDSQTPKQLTNAEHEITAVSTVTGTTPTSTTKVAEENLTSTVASKTQQAKPPVKPLPKRPRSRRTGENHPDNLVNSTTKSAPTGGNGTSQETALSNHGGHHSSKTVPKFSNLRSMWENISTGGTKTKKPNPKSKGNRRKTLLLDRSVFLKRLEGQFSGNPDSKPAPSKPSSRSTSSSASRRMTISGGDIGFIKELEGIHKAQNEQSPATDKPEQSSTDTQDKPPSPRS